MKEEQIFENQANRISRNNKKWLFNLKNLLDKLNRELYIIKERFSDQEGKSEYVDQNEA